MIAKFADEHFEEVTEVVTDIPKAVNLNDFFEADTIMPSFSAEASKYSQFQASSDVRTYLCGKQDCLLWMHMQLQR